MSAARVLVVSGSTRAASTNSAFARTAAAHPPAGVDVAAFTDLATLPHFDPDLDQEPLPASVVRWRALVEQADVVLVCTPEYAGALPGACKNALDWLVGATVMTDRPVAWITVSVDRHRGAGARAELATVLGYVQARVVPEACRHVPLGREDVGPDGSVREGAARAAVVDAVAAAVTALGLPSQPR